MEQSVEQARAVLAAALKGDVGRTPAVKMEGLDLGEGDASQANGGESFEYPSKHVLTFKAESFVCICFVLRIRLTLQKTTEK